MTHVLKRSSKTIYSVDVLWSGYGWHSAQETLRVAVAALSLWLALPLVEDGRNDLEHTAQLPRYVALARKAVFRCHCFRPRPGWSNEAGRARAMGELKTMSQRGHCPIPTATKGADYNHGKAATTSWYTYGDERKGRLLMIEPTTSQLEAN